MILNNNLLNSLVLPGDGSGATVQCNNKHVNRRRRGDDTLMKRNYYYCSFDECETSYYVRIQSCLYAALEPHTSSRDEVIIHCGELRVVPVYVNHNVITGEP